MLLEQELNILYSLLLKPPHSQCSHITGIPQHHFLLSSQVTGYTDLELITLILLGFLAPFLGDTFSLDLLQLAILKFDWSFIFIDAHYPDGRQAEKQTFEEVVQTFIGTVNLKPRYNNLSARKSVVEDDVSLQREPN